MIGLCLCKKMSYVRKYIHILTAVNDSSSSICHDGYTLFAWEGESKSRIDEIIRVYRAFRVRSCLDFISSLAERHFGIVLPSLGEANSGLFTRTERVKMPEMASDNPKSSSNTY